MKLFGFILITLSTTVCGICYASEKNERLKDLQSFCLMLELLRGELTYKLVPLSELAEKLSEELEGKASAFMQILSLNLASLGEKGFSIIWDESFDLCSLSFNDKECESIKELGKVLGRYDLQTQNKCITETYTILHDSLSTLMGAMPQIKKLSVGASMSAGALLAILLV